MKNIIIPGIVMLIIDIIFLSNYGGYMGKMIENIQNKKFSINYDAATLCYMLMSFSFYYFITKKNGSNMDAFILGLVIYGIYESTNMATFTDWKFNALIYDTLWGGCLFLLTKIISDIIFKKALL